MEDSTYRFLVAFVICCAAGLATMIGAFIVLFVHLKDIFIDQIIKLLKSNTKRTKYTILAYTNAFAAGVMTFVALIEILREYSLESFDHVFEKAEMKKAHATAYLATYGLFFAGVIICYLFNLALEYFLVTKDIMKLDDSLGDAEDEAGNDVENQQKIDPKDIMKISISTLIALTLHNIPEGIITFTETYRNNEFGYILAIAIGLHNIPEGLAVALPVYYATNSKIQPLLYALVSSVAEPIGGIIGYFIIEGSSRFWFNGIAFGIISGMMMWIVIYEMLPIALKYSKSKLNVAILFFLGSFLMAASEVILKFV